MTTDPTGHLPECYERELIGLDCICDRLRACEQRSYALGIEVGKHDGWIAGHAAGIQAAREAVAALDHYRVLECDPGLMLGKRDDPDPWSQGYLVYSDDALAAIDGLLVQLRGERS